MMPIMWESNTYSIKHFSTECIVLNCFTFRGVSTFQSPFGYLHLNLHLGHLEDAFVQSDLQ